MTLSRLFCLPFCLAVLLSACQDPTTIGTDLLTEDQAQVGFTDTITFRGSTVLGDSVRTYTDNPANQLRSYPFGRMVEPLLGTAESSIYLQVRPQFFKPDFSNSQLDSVVLVLPYDTVAVYGDLEATFGVDVLRMTEPMNRRATYYSSASFATDPNPVGSHDFVPNLDTITVLDYVGTQVRELSFPHLRVPLSDAFGEELLALDTLQIESDSAFLEELNGLYLQARTGTPGMLSFSLNQPPYQGGVYLYYTQDDTVKTQFQFAIEQLSARVPSYRMDYAGSRLGPLLGDPDAGDSVLVVQGLSGVNARLEFQGLDRLEGLVINKAELTVKLRDYPDNDTLVYPPVPQLLLSYENSAGQLTLINDVILGLNTNELNLTFGGRLDREEGTYTMNVTSHFQAVVAGDLPPVLVLSTLGKPENPGRSVLYGAGHPEFGVKLRVAYTEL